MYNSAIVNLIVDECMCAVWLVGSELGRSCIGSLNLGWKGSSYSSTSVGATSNNLEDRNVYATVGPSYHN